ncbi:unnamed protein product [Ectocarpus sp. 6 AP-2014]
MVDVKSPRCEMAGCRKQPCCGFPGLKPRFCSEHKQDGMLNLKTRAFRCKYRGVAGLGIADDPMMPLPAGKTQPCNRACRYAYPGEEAVYCQKHKLNGMVDVINPSCKMQECPEVPTHGYDGEAATFCQAHMAVGMKPIAAQKPTGLHWSAELRRQATANARERNKMEAEMEAGSARCTPLPPKAGTPEEKRMRQESAAAAAIEAAAASSRGPEAAAANMALNSREMLSASTYPIVPPFTTNEEVAAPPGMSITSAELALAFSGLPEDDMHSAAAAAHAAHAAAAAAAAAAAVGAPGFSPPLPALPGIGTEHLGRAVAPPAAAAPAAGTPDSGPAKKRRRGSDGSATPTSGPGVDAYEASSAAAAMAAAAASAAAAAAPASTVQYADHAAYHAALSSEMMAGLMPSMMQPIGELPPPPPQPAPPQPAAAPQDDGAAAQPPPPLSSAEALAHGFVPVPMVSTAPAPMDTSGPPPPMMSAGPPPAASAAPPAGAEAMLSSPEAFVMAGAVVPAIGSKCAVADCAAPATFGHPGPGHVPTHCLTHCEEGMHRLAADADRVAPLPLVAPPENGTAAAGEGIMLLAGAVASHTDHNDDDDDDDDEEEEEAEEEQAPPDADAATAAAAAAAAATATAAPEPAAAPAPPAVPAS